MITLRGIETITSAHDPCEPAIFLRGFESRRPIEVRPSARLALLNSPAKVEREVADHAEQHTGNQAGRWIAFLDILRSYI
jgi:hypothetical protein